jgi:putative membrane protein
MPYLSDPRVLFAAERTLLAWQRTAISLMGFGFIVERFGLFLQVVSATPLSPVHRGYSLWMGVAFLLLGACANVVSIIQFKRISKNFGPEEIPVGYWISAGMWMSAALAGLAIALVTYFVLSA